MWTARHIALILHPPRTANLTCMLPSICMPPSSHLRISILKSCRQNCNPTRNVKTHLRLGGHTFLTTNASPNGELQRLKHPARGGQNLSARYVRLEKSLLGKGVYLEEMGRSREVEEVANAGEPMRVGSRRKQPDMFKGFVIPEEPKPPGPDECCMSGCAVCVHDLYQESIEAYEAAVKALRASLTALGVDEREWPPRIRATGGRRKEDVALSAFERMELQLAAKQEEARKGPSVVDVDVDAVKEVKETAAKLPMNKKSDANAGALLEAINWVVFSRR